jgi:serine/threonine-protein kinase RsbW
MSTVKPKAEFGSQSMTSESWTLDQFIPSDTRVGNETVLRIVENMQRIGWSESELFGVHMALEEAIINAIKHGNKLAPEKAVHVEVVADGGGFFLRVTDEGEGFDPSAVPDCTLDENLELTSGRGLMLMNHYMDTVKYNERGNSLEIRKSR